MFPHGREAATWNQRCQSKSESHRLDRSYNLQDAKRQPSSDVVSLITNIKV
jgi:hypothetical protein